MRKSLFTILLSALLMAPSAASARDFKASFSNDNAEKAIAILEAATGYDFVCKKEIVNGVKRKIDGTYTASSLKDLLNEVVRSGMYNPQIQKSGETKTKGSKSGKNPEKSQFQAVIEI